MKAARRHNLQKAAEAFSLAETYAEDGAMVSAAIAAREGVEHLAREYTRRVPLRMPDQPATLKAAVDLGIAMRKAARKAAR